MGGRRSTHKKNEISATVQKWARKNYLRWLTAANNVIVAIPVVIILLGCLLLAIGKVSSLNLALGSSWYIFSSPTYNPDIPIDMMLRIFWNYDAFAIVVVAASTTVMICLVILVLTMVLNLIGRGVNSLIKRFMKNELADYIWLTYFVLWTIAVLTVWMVIDASQTIAIMVGLLIVGLLHIFMFSVIYRMKSQNSRKKVGHRN